MQANIKIFNDYIYMITTEEIDESVVIELTEELYNNIAMYMPYLVVKKDLSYNNENLEQFNKLNKLVKRNEEIISVLGESFNIEFYKFMQQMGQANNELANEFLKNFDTINEIEQNINYYNQIKFK